MADQDRVTQVAHLEPATSLVQRAARVRDRGGISLSNLRYWTYPLRKESRPLVTEASGPRIFRQAGSTNAPRGARPV
jgi:hypothetical protein